MILIYEPTVEVIASTLFRGSREASAQAWVCDETSSDAEDLIEFSGRSCYRSWPNPAGKTNERYIGDILAHEHYSVLEHASVTLWITGISRSCSHEVVRHRHFSFSQESQRFVPASEIGFVVPPAIIGDGPLIDCFHEDCRATLQRYDLMLERMQTKFAHVEDRTTRLKSAREAARSVLPNAAETRMVLTGNLRSWREAIQKRATVHADAEICRLAVRIFKVLQPLAPAVWQDMEIAADGDRQVVIRRSPHASL